MTSPIVKKLPVNNQKPSTVSVPFSLKLVLIIVLLINVGLYAQVGVNTTDPKSSLDISASNAASPANTDGILIPRIDAFPASDPGADQHGMLVFLNADISGYDSGFYYWNDLTDTWDWVNRVKKIDDLSDGKSDNAGSSVFLGVDAGAADNSGDNKNVGVGYQSLNAVTDGENNTSIGYQSSLLLDGGDGNTALGKGALSSNVDGSNNVAIGLNALSTSTLGGNIAIGKDAMGTSTLAGGNVAIGTNALKVSITGGTNIAIGGNSMAATTYGGKNTAIGASTLRANIDGDNNMALGAYSLRFLTTGQGNTAIGPYALNSYLGSSGTPNGNTAIGNQAMSKLTAGIGNTAIGFEALEYGALQDYNTGIGHFAGFHAGRDGVQIEGNTFIGKSAGFASTGNNNVYIGQNAGGHGTGTGTVDYATGSDNVYIGNSAGNNSTASDSSNTLIIENSSNTTHLIHGDFSSGEIGINWDSGTALPNTLSVNGNASKSSSGSWLANSDRRLKKNIETITPSKALDKITSLRGVTYEWNDTQTGIERSERIQYGFIAQELMEVFPENVSKDGLGFFQTAYGNYDALFVQAFKELKSQLNEKDQRINELESQVKSLQEFSERLDAIEAKLDLNKETSQIVSSK